MTLLRHLDRRRFEVSLGVVDGRGAAYRDDVPADVEFIDLKFQRIRYALPAIIRMIWRRRPDVVVSTLGQLNLALGMSRPILPRQTRFVARESVVVSALLRDMALGRLWALGYRMFYRRFDRVICQSRDMQDDLERQFGIGRQQTTLIPNPVDILRVRRLAAEAVDTGMIRAPGATPEVVHLVSAGRLVHQKGFDILIDAIARLADRRLRLTILGEGRLRAALERQSRALGVHQQVRFAGFQKNPFPFFARADAFVLASRFEGLPNAVLEALACRTPVIATPAPGGVEEILSEVAGCRLAAGVDADSLAAAISDVMPGRRLPENVVDRYAVNRVTQQYESLLAAPGDSACA